MTQAKPIPREAVLVVNAHSRRGRKLFRQARSGLLRAGFTLIGAHAVKDPTRLSPIVRNAVATGAPMIIVGGGDGSLSSAVDDLVDKDCVFALLPLGTANSFARTLGYPLDLDGAIQTIANGRRKRIDLGVINGDFFANCAAMGISPMIGEGIPHNLKRYLGRFGYLIWAIWCLIRFKPFELNVSGEGIDETVWATEVRMANGSYHGGVELIENAEVDSGEILIQAVIGRSVRGLVWNWFATFFKLPARQATTQEFRGRRLTVTTRPVMRISIDGEVTARTPATVEIAQRAIEVVVPA